MAWCTGMLHHAMKGTESDPPPIPTRLETTPRRTPTPNSPALVPYLDGNRPGRSPRVTWHGALVGEAPETSGGWRPWLRVDVSHQDDVYERQINGAYHTVTVYPNGSATWTFRGGRLSGQWRGRDEIQLYNNTTLDFDGQGSRVRIDLPRYGRNNFRRVY